MEANARDERTQLTAFIEKAERVFFFDASEHADGERADDPCRSEGIDGRVLLKTFPMLPSDSIWPLGVSVGMRRKGVQK